MTAPAFADQLRFSANNRYLAGKTLSRCVTLANAVGQLAEVGQRFNVADESKGKLIGCVQVGEYILTGSIPPRDLVDSVLHHQEVEQ